MRHLLGRTETMTPTQPPDGKTPDLSGTRAGPGGRYRLLYEIARGGMGAVYRAEDEQFGRALAVKVMLGSPARSPGLVRRFEQEARITGQLQHPGVPPAHDVGTLPDGRPYLAMKLVEGQTLAELFAVRSSPAEAQARVLGVFEAVCRVIAYAHARGIAHNDLKPGNVMVGAFGEIQVMDWGLAQPQTPPGAEAGSSEYPPPPPGGDAVLGTPAYMAPERAHGGRGGLRSDVFSLGAILCELLTGRPPFAGTPLVRALAGDTSEAARRLRGVSGPPGLAELAARCLDADPAGRPADAGELAALVSACQEEARVRLRQADAERVRAAERAERGRMLALVVVAAVAMAVLAGLSVYLSGREEARLAAEQERREEAARRAAGAALTRARELAGRRAWADALAALAPAREQPGGLGEQLLGLETGLRLALDLEQARLAGRLAPPEAGPRLAEQALARHGISFTDDAAAAAARLRGEPGLTEILAALYERLAREEDEGTRRWLLAVLDRADADPWRARLRTAAGRAELEALAAEPPTDAPPAGAVRLLASRLGEDAGLAFRRRMQAAHPGHLWYALDLSADLARTPGHLTEALAVARAALAARPSAAAVWYNLGQLLRRARRPAEASEAFGRAAGLASDSTAVRVGLALALAEGGRADKAAEQVAWVFDREPDNPDAHVAEGLLKVRVGDMAGAARSLLCAVEAAPRHGVAWAHLALVRQRQGDLHAAALAARRAVALSPEDALPWVALGLSTLAAQEYTAADDALTRAASLGGIDGALLTARLPADAEAALRQLAAALAYDPGHRPAEALMAARVGKAPALARGLLEDVALCQPDRAAVWSLLGRARSAAGRTDAVAAWRRAAALAPTDPEPRLEVGLALWRNADKSGARSALFNAWGLAPRDARAMSVLVALLMEMGRTREAEQMQARARRDGVTLLPFTP